MPNIARLVPVMLGVCLLACCGEQRPDLRLTYVRGIELKILEPPKPPALRTDDTSDEAEIQFRAAFSFYRSNRWNYAATAFAEALDYDEGRDDARFYLAASLLMAERNTEALPHLDVLMESAYEMPARALLGVALYRLNRGAEARTVVSAAERVNYDAAGWAARYDLLFARAKSHGD